MLTNQKNIAKLFILPKAIQIQCNAYKNFKGIFYRNRKKILKPQKTLNSQLNPEKEQNWRHQTSDFKLYYKPIVIKTVYIVLAQKQKYRSMEQDGKPRNKPTHLW